MEDRFLVAGLELHQFVVAEETRSYDIQSEIHVGLKYVRVNVLRQTACWEERSLWEAVLLAKQGKQEPIGLHEDIARQGVPSFRRWNPRWSELEISV